MGEQAGRDANGDVEARVAGMLAERRFEDAYRSIVEAMGPGVRGYLRAITRNDSQSDELYQDLRVALWESLPRLAERRDLRDEGGEPAGTIRAWLYRSARNRAIDWLRRRSRDNVRLASDADRVLAAPNDTSAVRHRERAALVAQVSGELTEVERDVFILRVERDLSFREIGEVLGVTAAAAKERFHRARERLKRLLSGHDAG